MKSLGSIRDRLARLTVAVPVAPSESCKTSEEMIREVAAIVAEADEHEAALAALPAEQQAAARVGARLEFIRGLEEGGDEARNQWAAMHEQAVRVLADPTYGKMVPVLRRFVEGVAASPPATDVERAQLAREVQP